jgi:hypothetical protein
MRYLAKSLQLFFITSLFASGACSDERKPSSDQRARDQRTTDGPAKKDGLPQDGARPDQSLDASGPEAPHIDDVTPSTHAGGVAFTLKLSGKRFASDAVAMLDGQALATTFVSPTEIEAAVGAQKRGSKLLTVKTSKGKSNAVSLTIENSLPSITDPGAQAIDEETDGTVQLTVSDFDGDSVRVFVSGLPPGAVWNEAQRTITFRPDFIQGGKSHTVLVTATDGNGESTQRFALAVNDTVKTKAPTVVRDEDKGDYRLVTLSQVTDAYLDSTGHAGRSFTAHVTVPKSASASNKVPVNVSLHGFNGGPGIAGKKDRFVIYPHDPHNTYWWGYAASLPGGQPQSGLAPNYTQRRVLALLEWVLGKYQGADAHRVYVSGGSMGGAGAKTLGLLYARHFCYVEATIGQAIPRNHRPLRITQLSGHWGSPTANLKDDRGMSVWDRMDLTRALRDDIEAKNQFVFTKHGKDDDIIHFGAMVQASALTSKSFYDALQHYRAGHYVVWDEGGHGQDDPVLGPFWSDWGWDRVTDSETFLRRDLLFPAFAKSSADQDPGDGTGNGKQTWDDNRGYSGTLSVAGDTGWKGDIAGCRNRFLRWQASAIVDSRERIELPLKVLDSNGDAGSKAGYPTKGNKLDKPLPVTVDVTLRRLQRFACLPNETGKWTFGSASDSGGRRWRVDHPGIAADHQLDQARH